MLTDDEMVGKIVRYPSGRARIVVCSQLLSIVLLDLLDDHDQPTGLMVTANPNTFTIAFPENA